MPLKISERGNPCADGGAPLLLVFLDIGLLAGEDGLLGINFDSGGTAYFIASLALAITGAVSNQAIANWLQKHFQLSDVVNVRILAPHLVEFVAKRAGKEA